MNGLFHTVLAGANVGVFLLAAAAVVFRLLIRGHWLAEADQVAWVAATAGLVLALLTGLTGASATWPMEAIRGTILARNKVGVTTILVTAWGMFVLLRWRAGPGLWEHRVLRVWSAFLVLVGFGATILAGSMGGSASLKGTLLEPVLDALDANRFQALSWPPALSIVLIVVAVALMVYRPRRPQLPRPGE